MTWGLYAAILDSGREATLWGSKAGVRGRPLSVRAGILAGPAGCAQPFGLWFGLWFLSPVGTLGLRGP